MRNFLTGAAIILAFLAGMFTQKAIDNVRMFPHRIVTSAIETLKPPPSETEMRAAVVTAVHSTFQVTTANVDLAKYIKRGICDAKGLSWWAYSNCLHMQVPATVSEGFDLSSFKASDVSFTPKEIIVNIGAPKVFLVEVHHKKVRMYRENRGVVSFFWDDTKLPVETLGDAVDGFRKDACTSGGFNEATASAKKDLGILLGPLHQGDARAMRIVASPPRC